MELSGRRGIIVIGAAKAASTTIAAAIGSHPDVAALDGEYFGFVERDDDTASRAELQGRFAALADRSRYVFKCAAYLAAGDLAPRLRSALGDVDVVAVLRDPVERAISGWYWAILCGFAPAIDHEVGLRQLLNRDIDRAEWPHVDEVLTWGLYAQLLAPWLAEFGEDRLHIITEDDVADLPRTITRLHQAMGLTYVRPRSAPMRLNEGVYSLVRLRWLARRLPMRWHLHLDGVWRLGRPRRLGLRALDAGITLVDRAVLRPFARRAVAVSPQLRQMLTDYYREDQDELVRFQHRRLSSGELERATA